MTSTLLIVVLQGLLLAPQVSSLSAYTDDAHRLRQHQHQGSATMDGHGLMRAEVTQHQKTAHAPLAKVMLQQSYPFFHTTDEIKSEAIRLSKACDGNLNVTTVKDGDVDIDVITVRKASAKPANKVFILFGEHSRELISPESGLYFLKAICGDVTLQVPAQKPSASGLLQRSPATDVLEDAEFQMILNSNPRSRQKVENGDYCLRTNPADVDLNRNWDERWSKAAAYGESSNPGPHPFSEPETRIFKRLVTEYAPTSFLTVHSGTRGMYMPWAYDQDHTAQYNSKEMMEVLRVLDKDHCQCPFGAAGREVGYPCPGTCLDYAYAKLKTPFAFAFEIYVNRGDQELKQRFEEKMRSGGAALLENGKHLGHPHFRDVFDKHGSDFVGSSSMMEKSSLEGLGNDFCLNMFNPTSQDEFDKVVKNWAVAYIQMSTMIAKKLRAGEVVQPTSNELAALQAE